MNRKGQISKTMTFIFAFIAIIIFASIYLYGVYRLDKVEPTIEDNDNYLAFLNDEILINNEKSNLVDSYISYKYNRVSRESLENIFIEKVKEYGYDCAFISEKIPGGNPSDKYSFFVRNVEIIENPGNEILDYMDRAILLPIEDLDFEIYIYGGKCL